MATEHAELLLVEDDADDLALTLHEWRKLNLTDRVKVVRDGPQALAYLEQAAACRPESAQPRVVILDLKLPMLNGLEVLRRIKENPETRRIPVVVFSSSRQPSDIDECYRLGASSYIVKPVDFASFRQTVRQLGTYWLHANEAPDLSGA